MLGIPEDDFNRIYNSHDFSSITLKKGEFDYSVHRKNSIEAFGYGMQITSWEVDLSNRITQSIWCWIGLAYYKQLGIPDERYSISPGSGGESVEYFPDFKKEKNHYFHLSMFSFFSSVFHSKIYTAWDTLGQILNLMFDLRIKKVDFHQAVNCLKAVRPYLYTDLQIIIDSKAFKFLKTLRHQDTHNESPTGISGFVTKIPNGFTFGGGTYTQSQSIVDNSIEVLNLFGKTIKSLREQIIADT